MVVWSVDVCKTGSIPLVCFKSTPMSFYDGGEAYISHLELGLYHLEHSPIVNP